MNLPEDQCNRYLTNLPIDLKQWIIAVTAELKEAQLKHPSWPSDFVHAAAIVSEESGELVRAANLFQWENGCYNDMYDEATQTAAMCFRFLLNAQAPRNKNVISVIPRCVFNDCDSQEECKKNEKCRHIYRK